MPSMETQETSLNSSFHIPFQDEIEETAAAIKPAMTLATALGVFGLVLGAAEVLRTRRTSKISGIDKKYTPILRTFGVREIVSGVGLLASSDKSKWLMSRVVGDVLDGAFLGYAYYNERRPDSRKKIVKAFLAITPIVMVDVYALSRANRAN